MQSWCAPPRKNAIRTISDLNVTLREGISVGSARGGYRGGIERTIKGGGGMGAENVECFAWLSPVTKASCCVYVFESSFGKNASARVQRTSKPTKLGAREREGGQNSTVFPR